MANCSPDVIWNLVRDTSCFTLKRRVSRRTGMGKAGVHLTLEPNNLTGINSFKYSGLANAKAVGIEPAEDGKGIVLTTKSKKSDRVRKVCTACTGSDSWGELHCSHGACPPAAPPLQPVKSLNKVTLTKPFRKTAKTIMSQTSGNFYRADLERGEPAPELGWHCAACGYCAAVPCGCSRGVGRVARRLGSRVQLLVRLQSSVHTLWRQLCAAFAPIRSSCR